MKSVLILAPKASMESAVLLGRHIGAGVINPFETDQRDFRGFDLIFNYGCNRSFKRKAVINTPKGISNCINKIKTLSLLKEAKVNIPDFRTNKKDIPVNWEDIVVRETVEGNQGKGLSYITRGKRIPDAPLYTEYFEHKSEIRCYVYQGNVVANYIKERVKRKLANGLTTEDWQFIHLDPAGFEKINKQAVKAAKALEIDFVGFDILANTPDDFIFLEANSGPIMTPDVAKFIRERVHND